MINRILYFSFVSVFMFSCGGGTSSGPKYDLKGFATESIGGGATYARFDDQNKWPLSTGHTINGVQNGTWTTYYPDSYKIKTKTNYINGKKNGAEITLSDRGYLESIVGYRNDQLHGLSARYKNSRTISETTYANGAMDGPFKVFDENNGKLQRSGSFKNGKQHGELLFYNAEGAVTLRYEYKDGEKISGGIVETEGQ